MGRVEGRRRREAAAWTGEAATIWAPPSQKRLADIEEVREAEGQGLSKEARRGEAYSRAHTWEHHAEAFTLQFARTNAQAHGRGDRLRHEEQRRLKTPEQPSRQRRPRAPPTASPDTPPPRKSPRLAAASMAAALEDEAAEADAALAVEASEAEVDGTAAAAESMRRRIQTAYMICKATSMP